jgi:hypothetical protein
LAQDVDTAPVLLVVYVQKKFLDNTTLSLPTAVTLCEPDTRGEETPIFGISSPKKHAREIRDIGRRTIGLYSFTSDNFDAV